MPHREVLDGVLVIFGGAFLITPGFLTDIVGLLLLLPPTRRWSGGWWRAGWAAGWRSGRRRGRGGRPTTSRARQRSTEDPPGRLER